MWVGLDVVGEPKNNWADRRKKHIESLSKKEIRAPDFGGGAISSQRLRIFS